MSVFPARILLATDGSEDAVRATEAAVDLAGRSGSELHLVYVWHDVHTPYAHGFVKRELERQGQEILDAQMKRIEDAGGSVTKAHLREGRTSDEVLELGDELDAGLLVVGSQGYGRVRSILMGSHSEDVVQRAHRPVLVVRRGQNAWPPSRVVVGDDSSDDAKRSAELAANIGKLYGAEILLAHAYPRFLERSDEAKDEVLGFAGKELESRARELEEISGSKPEIRTSAGEAAAVILEAAREKDSPALIAVGSRGLGTIGRARLGSVSTKVVRAARGPVLVCPHTD